MGEYALSKPNRNWSFGKQDMRRWKGDMRSPAELLRFDKPDWRGRKADLSGAKLHLRCPKGDLR